MALDNIAQLIAAGFARGQVAKLNSGGYPMGLTGTLSAGSSVGLYDIQGVQNANVQIPQAEKTTVMGNNQVMAAFLWKPGDTPEWDMDCAVIDMDLAAAAENVKVRDLDKWSIHPIAAEDLVYDTMMLLLSTNAQSKDSGSDGLDLWYHVLIPRVQMAYLGPAGLTMRGENLARYHCIVSPTSLLPWGESMSLDNEGTTRAPILEWISEYKLSIDTIALEAATAQITLAYTPAMDAVTAGSGILGFSDGSPITLTSVDPGTKVVDFTGPGESTGVFLYEHL
jgi:hypothetical protein